MQGPKWTERQRAARLDKLVERNRSGHTGPRLYEDADWMRDAYVTRGLTLREVAAEAACGLRTVARWMRIHDISTRIDVAPRVKRGPEHPNWKGGRPACAACGMPVAGYGSRTHARCRDRSGNQNPKWRGENISYAGAHGRVDALRGRASLHSCAHCGAPADEWAYDHEDPDERRDPDRHVGPFSLDPKHYMPLCVRCHRRFDLGPIGQARKRAGRPAN